MDERKLNEAIEAGLAEADKTFTNPDFLKAVEQAIAEERFERFKEGMWKGIWDKPILGGFDLDFDEKEYVRERIKNYFNTRMADLLNE